MPVSETKDGGLPNALVGFGTLLLVGVAFVGGACLLVQWVEINPHDFGLAGGLVVALLGVGAGLILIVALGLVNVLAVTLVQRVAGMN